MAKGEITIKEDLCRGCGYCTIFCPRQCVEIQDKLSSRGFLVAVFAHPEKCSACGTCGSMCPDGAITVYKYKSDETA